MIDFFIIRMEDLLTAVRVVLLIAVYLCLVAVVLWSLKATREAISCFRWISKAIDYEAGFLGQVKDSYRVVLREVRLKNNLDYWDSSQDWRYYDEKTDRWVLGRDAKEPVYNDDEECWSDK